MSKDIFWTSVTFSIMIAVLVLAFWPSSMTHMTVRYDCSIAEISPDYPVAVKEACRTRNKK